MNSYSVILKHTHFCIKGAFSSTMMTNWFTIFTDLLFDAHVGLHQQVRILVFDNYQMFPVTECYMQIKKPIGNIECSNYCWLCSIIQDDSDIAVLEQATRFCFQRLYTSKAPQVNVIVHMLVFLAKNSVLTSCTHLTRGNWRKKICCFKNISGRNKTLQMFLFYLIIRRQLHSQSLYFHRDRLRVIWGAF